MKQKNTLSETYTLMNGINIPKIGLGTWFIPDDEAAAAVCKAVEIGYRHIDTAQAYENERGIGKGVRDCGISRQKLFITTKLAAELKTYEEAAQAITGSLEKMGLDYIDLMLIHSPQPWTDFRGGDYAAGNREAWRALEDAYKAGKIRAIGISNFQEHDIQAGMCDEVSVVIAPVADGSSKTPALFNAKDEWASDTPVAFELQSAEIKDGGSVWLRYLVKR